MEVRSSRRAKEPLSQINVTPMVDVMLVLLIIFMVTASVSQEGITVHLPKAKAAATPTPDETMLTVTIAEDLQVYLNGEAMSVDELQSRLTQAMGVRKSKAVFLKADQSVPYGEFVNIVSRVKETGVEQLGMMTTPPPK